MRITLTALRDVYVSQGTHQVSDHLFCEIIHLFISFPTYNNYISRRVPLIPMFSFEICDINVGLRLVSIFIGCALLQIELHEQGFN